MTLSKNERIERLGRKMKGASDATPLISETVQRIRGFLINREPTTADITAAEQMFRAASVEPPEMDAWEEAKSYLDTAEGEK